MSQLWKVKALKVGVPLINAVGQKDVAQVVNRLGWMPVEDAKRASEAGEVEILSAPGRGLYNTKVMTPAKPSAAASSAPVAPSVEPASVIVATPAPAPAKAPSK